MVSNVFFVVCVQAIVAQIASSQYAGRAAPYDGFVTPCRWGGRGLGYGGRIADGAWPARGFGVGCGGPGMGITATSGGGFPVSSGSALPPVGVSLASDNVYEGVLATTGELPFVGTVSVDEVLPTAGAGAVSYGCGNGATAMVSDTAPATTGPIGPAGAGLGNRGLAGNGCGCSL